MCRAGVMGPMSCPQWSVLGQSCLPLIWTLGGVQGVGKGLKAQGGSELGEANSGIPAPAPPLVLGHQTARPGKHRCLGSLSLLPSSQAPSPPPESPVVQGSQPHYFHPPSQEHCQGVRWISSVLSEGPG